MDKLHKLLQNERLRIDRVKQRAQELNKKYNKYPVPPILLEDIIKSEQLIVKVKEFKNSIVAELIRSERTIYLTSNKALLAKWGNFALAHELGHWFFHTDNEDYFDPSEIKNINDIKNLEANCFAAYLLLPDQLMREYAWLGRDRLASAFSVSKEGIEFRECLS